MSIYLSILLLLFAITFFVANVHDRHLWMEYLKRQADRKAGAAKTYREGLIP